MITFPNAKVNIGLYITAKRPDGFHNIETVFVPIPELCDILEILPVPHQTNSVSFTQGGLKIDGPIDQNLCIKAYHLLSKKTELPKVAIHLHKQIPMGAGLGGGSADGAFALKMLNQISANPVSQKELASIALELGSDCPFFLINSPCFGSGQGEILDQVSFKLDEFYIVLVNPNIHINTGNAYKQSTPSPAPINLRQLAEIEINQWKQLVSNDFEKVVFPHHPEIEQVKNKLYKIGAVYASMSGSGSTVFGIFKAKPVVEGLFGNMFTYTS